MGYNVCHTCAKRRAGATEILTVRWNDVQANELVLEPLKSPKKSARMVACPKLMGLLRKWREAQSREDLANQDDFVFKGTKSGTHIRRQAADSMLRKVCARLDIKGASTHSFRLTWLRDQPDQCVAQRALYSSRSVGEINRHDPAAQGAILDHAFDPYEETPTAPPPLSLDSEWGAMAGAHQWQSIRLVANTAGDVIPDAPAINGLYVVRLNSIQAYVGMSVNLERRLAKELRHAPRMIGTLPGGSVWILPIPRIYNLALLEEIYIAQTSPCLNQIWDDLRFQVFPATQSCMTSENKCYLIETIYSRHRAALAGARTADPRDDVGAEDLDSLSRGSSELSTQVPNASDGSDAASETTTPRRLNTEVTACPSRRRKNNNRSCN